MYKKIKTLIFILIILILIFVPIKVNAQNDTVSDIDKIYDEQLEISGAENIYHSLDEYTKEHLNDIGITSISWKELNSLNFFTIFNQVLIMFYENGQTPLVATVQIIGLIILCALAQSLKFSAGNSNLSSMVGLIGTLCTVAILVFPISNSIYTSVEIIKSATNFMLLYIPILVGVMISCGQVATASSYYTVMTMASQSVTLISSNFIIPILNMFLGLSVISAVTSKVNLVGICSLFASVIKWTLTFVMSIFVSVLSFQTIISGIADSTGVRATKFAISSVIPVVGSALGDAYLTVQSCMKMLKSGIGVFVIIASAFIFLPAIVECILWLFTLNICAALGDVFDISPICKLLRNCIKVISTLLAVLLCFTTVFVISSTLIMLIGGT